MTDDLIHASAVIAPGAELGRGVRIGPGSVIGPEVVVGAGTAVGAHAVIEGRVTIGARCQVGHGAVIGAPPQDLKYRPGTPSEVRIGEDTIIREHATVHRAATPGGATVIGRGCFIMTAAHVAHDCQIGDEVIVINGAGLSGHVVVEERAIVGGMTGLQPFVRIGTYAYVGGCSGLRQDVPPFVVASGAPAKARGVNVVGMRRGGIGREGRRRVQTAYAVLYRSGLARAEALERLRAELGGDPLVGRMIDFIARSKRGIIEARQRGEAPESADREESLL
jgi:UDP-N-acetylglucosamine acyltransferase